MPLPTFRCALIGETSLLVRCAELLVERGHEIAAIVADSPREQQWARERGLRLVPTPADLAAAIGDEPVDWIFSIVNYRVLPAAVVGLARHGAINFHDAPLPRYAGMHATSWALLAGERVHGISWHRITDEIDAGDVLAQRAVPVDPDDTAIALNTKCSEAAYAAFGELVDGLALGTVTPRPQELSRRTYFGRDRVPPGAGLLDWTQPALEVTRVVRALDFGPTPNTLGPARILLGEAALVCDAAEVVPGPEAPPGTVLEASAHHLVVACGDGAVALRALRTRDGVPVTAAQLVAAGALAAGARLPLIASEARARAEAACAQAAPHERFWARRANTLLSVAFPFWRARHGLAGPSWETASLPVPESIAALADAAGVDRATAVLTLVAAYLTRLMGETACHVAYSTDATRAAAANALGLLARTVPLRLEIAPGDSFASAARRLASELALVQRHGTFAVDVVARRMVRASVPPLQVGVSIGGRDGGALPASITIALDADGEHLSLVRDPAHLADDDATRILAHLRTLFEDAGTDPTRPIDALELLPASERQLLLETWAGVRVPSSDDTLVHVFDEQVSRTPDLPALEDERTTLTYAELASASSALARRLLDHGVGPGVRVGIVAERSVEMVVAIQAVLRAGGCYVPLDPEYPAARLRFMLDDADVRVLLATASVAPTLPALDAPVLLLAGAAEARHVGPQLPMPDADDPAYMIYTSGSTGRPKGAVNAHRGIVAHLRWMQREYALTATDAVLQKTPFAFDLSLWELLWPFLTGARLVMARPGGHGDSRYLADVIAARGVTVCAFVPTMLRAMVESGMARRCGGLRDVLAIGEALPPDLVAAFHGELPGTRLHNLYGPTECAVAVSYWPCPPSPVALDVVPIGRPIANTRFYVLDAQGRPCPIGVSGELCLAGVQVGLGYHGRPELTAERFVPDPFAPADEVAPRMYKTGDLARWRAEGTVEYLGRLDFQVKLRGFRIELGEIEAVLREHAAVQDAVVVARELQPGNLVLVGYVQPTTGSTIDAAALRAFVGTRLPDYMVPTTVMALDALPLTPTGKVDRTALPDPELRSTGAEAVAPRDEVEARILHIWAQLLGTPNIGVTDRFNDVGGHSLAAVRLFTRMAREFGREFQLLTILKHDTVEKLAALVRGPADAETWHCIVPLNDGGAGQPVFCLPPQSGRLLLYQHLAKELTGRHPFLGVQGYGNWGTQQPMATVEAAAAYYADEIVAAQPAGPYALYGISLGGWLALEVARLLRERGHTVNFVAMHDSTGPDYPRLSLAGRVVKFAREHGGISFVRLRRIFRVAPLDRLAVRAVARVVRDVLLKAREEASWWASNTYRDFLVWRYESRPVPPGVVLPDNGTRLCLAGRRLRALYRPAFYDGHLTLFRAAIQPYGAHENPTNGWAPVVGSIEIVPAPGGHTGAFFRPEVVAYAATFAECLARHVDPTQPIPTVRVR